MDGTKLDYTLTNPHSPQSARFTQRSLAKNQEHQVFFSVSAISSQLDPNHFDLARNFGPLSGTHQTEAPYPYPRPCDIFSPDNHRSPFPQSQEAPLADVTSYIYDSGSSSYPSNLQASHSSYNISSGHEAFHVNLNEDLSTTQSLSFSITSSLDLAIQPSPTTFSSIPSNYSAVRRYHEDQSRQHAQVLHQLKRSRDGRRQSSTDDLTGNGVLSASLEITPTGRRAELYHAASSIPMSNIRPHQPRPPEHASHQSRSLNQYQYPYYHNQDLGYQENSRSGALDVSPAHGLPTQGVMVYETTRHESISAFHVPAKTVTSPSTANSAAVANAYTMRSGPRSNTIQSMSQPSTHLFEETTATAKVHPSSNLSDMASITSPFPVVTNATDHEDPSTGGTENVIEIESENGDEKLTKGRKEAANVVAKRRDKRQSEGSGATARRRAGDPKNDSIIKDGLSPPTKKRKKSKMHECQVCHKNFPRPSGLKTHMNTHNNERPYPCPFPGCSRSFGVRSNAKRHLRTHGVIPPQNTGAQPYVVDFSTPMVLEQDGRMGLNGEEGAIMSRDDDGRSGDVPHTQRLRAGRGRGRQFKLRWMPPSSSKSAMVKGKGRKKAADSPSDETGGIQDVDDIKPSFSPSPSHQSGFLDRDEDDPEEDAAGHTDGEEDAEMDFGDEGDEQDEESEAEEVDRSEEEFGATTAMRTGVPQFRPGLAHDSPASSSRTSLSSSISASASTSTSAGSTSAFSLPPSASSSSFTSLSPAHAQNPSLLGGINANFIEGVPISSPPSSQNYLQAPLSATYVSLG